MDEQAKFDFSFREMHIGPEHIESLMGYSPGSSLDPVPGLIKKVLEKAPGKTDICAEYRILPSRCRNKKNELEIGGKVFRVGPTVFRCLDGSRYAALLLCTAGKDIERWSKELITAGEALYGYIVDLLGSVIVETACERILSRLETEMNNRGMNISHPYSPGYCGWPVDDQQQLFSFFPHPYTGIQLSESSLMYPVKSISAVAGIGEHMQKGEYACQLCDARNCPYRDKRIIKTQPA